MDQWENILSQIKSVAICFGEGIIVLPFLNSKWRGIHNEIILSLIPRKIILESLAPVFIFSCEAAIVHHIPPCPVVVFSISNYGFVGKTSTIPLEVQSCISHRLELHLLAFSCLCLCAVVTITACVGRVPWHFHACVCHLHLGQWLSNNFWWFWVILWNFHNLLSMFWNNMKLSEKFVYLLTLYEIFYFFVCIFLYYYFFWRFSWNYMTCFGIFMYFQIFFLFFVYCFLNFF